MPISLSEFEGGELDISFLILNFLRSSSDYAYTIGELVTQLESEGANLTNEEMKSVLRSLENAGKIEAKAMGGIVYYIYRKPSLGFRVPGR